MKKPLFLVVVGVLFATMLACQFIPANLPQLPTAVIPTIQPVPTLVLPQGGDNPVQSQDLLVNLFKQVNPGIVAVRVITAQGGGEGSGFVFDSQGHIVTNYHVVQDNTSLEVDFPPAPRCMVKKSAPTWTPTWPW